MKDFRLKPNEVVIFTDFNNTLVDYANEYNSMSYLYGDSEEDHVRIKGAITKALKTFEKKTGLVPVVCIVTNASVLTIDDNNAKGISQDLRMTFFNHGHLSTERAKYMVDNTCEKYIKYLIYKENDFFIKIDPMGSDLDSMFEPIMFDEKTRDIKLIPQFKKQESVQRMLKVLDPDGTRIKYAIFAGDSIKDDYPMKYALTDEGVCRIFIRPGKTQKMKANIKKEFCEAKGVEFTSVHPRSGKKMKIFDDFSIKFLNDRDRAELENFSDGDHILLTNKNSRGFVEGIYGAIDIINGLQATEAKKME